MLAGCVMLDVVGPVRQCAQGLATEVILKAWLATVQGRWLGAGHVWRSLCVGEGCLVAAACTGVGISPSMIKVVHNQGRVCGTTLVLQPLADAGQCLR